MLVGRCLEKLAVCAGKPSAFELAVKWWFPALHPSWQRQAVSEQASEKECGGSLLLLTPEGVCFAHSGGVLRVTKALGAMCGLAVRLRGPEHHRLVPVVARAVWVAGALAVCSSEPSCCRLKSSPSSVCLGLAARPGKWHVSVCGRGGL